MIDRVDNHIPRQRATICEALNGDFTRPSVEHYPICGQNDDFLEEEAYCGQQ